MLKSELIADIELRLYRGKPSDDVELDKRQIEIWLDKYRAALISDYIKENFDIPDETLERFDCQAVKTSNPVCLANDCFSDYYVELPINVLQLPGDLGVFKVALQASSTALDRLHSGEIDIYIKTKYSKPSRKYPAWYRIGSKVYFIGAAFGNKKIRLELVASTTKHLNDSDEYPIPASLIPNLIELVVRDGLSQLTQGTYDINADGKE